MRDPFVPESTRRFRASMRAAARKSPERVRGKAMLRVIVRTLRYILQYKWRVAFDLLLVLIGSLLALIPPILLSQMLVDNVLLKAPVDYARFQSLPQARLVYWITEPWHASGPGVLLIVVLICFLTVQGLLAGRTVFFTWWDWNVKNRILQRLRTTLVGRILQLGLNHKSAPRVGDIIWRVQHDCESIRQFYQRVFVEVWNDLIGITTNVASLFMLNAAAATVALCIIPLAIALNMLLVMPVRRAARRMRETNSELMSKIDATFGAIRAVVAFGREKREQREYRDLSWEALDWELGHEVWRVALVQSVIWGLQFGHCALIFYAAFAVWKGWLTIGQWGVLNTYYMAVQNPVQRLSAIWSFLQTQLVGLDRAYTMLDQTPDVADRPAARPLGQVRDAIEFRNVTCEFEAGHPVVKNVSLTARVGTITAIVGPVGAGKTTLISLIPRFYDPIEGTVAIDGVDVRDYTVDSLRSRVALALQENRLFSASILENLLYGSSDGSDGNGARPPTADGNGRAAEAMARQTETFRMEDLDDAAQADLRKAVHAAGLESIVASQPQGFDTVVSEHASRLNGGEKQRIGVARAFLRNAPILLLDEPTTSLDAAASAELLRNVRELSRERIVFIVAHRLAAASHADQILFMDNGEIAEVGTHDDLMRIEGGRYRAFYEALYRDAAPAGQNGDAA